MTLATYKSDGGFVAGQIPLLFILTAVAGIPLGIVYQALSFYMPCFGVVTVLLLGGYGALLGLIAGGIGKFIKNRNLMVHLAGAAFGALTSYYFAWVTFSWCLFNREEIDGAPIFLPWDLYQLAVDVAPIGYFTIGSSSSSNGDAVSGWFLWLIWVVEALTIFGLGTFVGCGYTSEPFFARSMVWGAGRKIHRTFGGDNLPATKAAFLDDDTFSWTRNLVVDKGEGTLQFEFFEAPNEELSYLTISRGVLKKENKETVLKHEPVVSYLELTPTMKRRLEADLENARETASEPDAAAESEKTADSPRNEEIETDGKWDNANKPEPKPAAPPPTGKAKPAGDEWDS